MSEFGARAAPNGVLSAGEVARLERLTLTADRPVGGRHGGAHRSVRRGRSLDFADWRDYEPGDDPRTIDVQAWARLDQVLVRLYEADVDLTVHVIVDTSASMGFGDKLRQAQRTVAAIGVVALGRNETLSVSTLHDRVPRRYRGRGALGPLLAHVGAWDAAGPTRLAERAAELALVPRGVGVTAVISDFLTPGWAEAVDRLSVHRDQLVAMAIGSPVDLLDDVVGEMQLVDSETGELVDADLTPDVVAAFRRRRGELRAAMAARVARRGGRWLATDASDDLIGTVVPRLLDAGVIR